MKKKLINILNEADNALKRLLQVRKRVTVAIDGNSGAGKSTLAAELKLRYDSYGCSVIAMDDFFLRPPQRSESRLSEPGGNVDYERFSDEVLTPLLSGKDFLYRPYNCRTQTLNTPIHIADSKLLIVEGVYSLHPKFADVYDLKLFLHVDFDEQLKRIKARNPGLFHRFRDEWIPMENAYFETFEIKQSCDFVYDTTDLSSFQISE
ncbi:MAG: uridine kinase [Oscillospiraceae bacterium]|nr:uridine kinase [Oscillospiraceae bacterium]